MNDERNPGKASLLYPNVFLLGLMCSQVVQDVFHHLYQYACYAWFARVKHLREKGMVGRVIARYFWWNLQEGSMQIAREHAAGQNEKRVIIDT